MERGRGQVFSDGGSERITTEEFVPALHLLADSLNDPTFMAVCSSLPHY